MNPHPEMIVDFHTHFYPKKIAERALEAIIAAPGVFPCADGTRNGLLSSMREASIDISLGLPLANTPDNVRGVSRWAAIHNQPPIYLLGSIHPRTKEMTKTVKWIAAQGLKGIKVHPEYQNFTFDDESVFPLWEACQNNDLFVLTHAGLDMNFSPPFRSNPRMLADFHRRFPGLTLVIAHMGSWGMWDEVEEMLCGLPVFLDMSFTLGKMDDDQLIRIIRKHGAEWVLFGSDSPWRSQKEAVEHFMELPLNEEEKSLIMYKNACRLLDIKQG